MNSAFDYYISDDISITVTGQSDSVYTLDVSCPQDLSFPMPLGQEELPVNWSPPILNFNCPNGAEYKQITGPVNGSSLTTGDYLISYLAEDNCGQQQECSFSIRIYQEPENNSALTIECPPDIIINTSLYSIPGMASGTWLISLLKKNMFWKYPVPTE